MMSILNSPGWLEKGEGALILQAARAQWARAWGPLLRNEISKEAPVHSGRLKSSIRMTTGTGIDFVSISIWSNAPYAGYVASGTQGGQTIVPVARRALHWTNGGDVFAKSVTRGSTSANDYPHRGYAKIRAAMDANLAEMVGKGLVKK